MKTNPRILAIHDLSAFGNTSLMAVIPIMYHYGISVCALPSVILSTSTMYEGAQKIETTGKLSAFGAHWKSLDISFSAIYTGFLDSPGQVDPILRIIEDFSGGLVLVDPVLADDGELYSCYEESMIPAMQRLVSKAGLITPNYTEACLLTGIEYQTDPGKIDISALCHKLAGLGARQIVITSIPARETDNKTRQSQVVYYDSGLNRQKSYPCKYIPCFFPGTGDIFSSVLLAEHINGKDIEAAIPPAIDFVQEAILLTLSLPHKMEDGVLLEKLLTARQGRISRQP